MAKLLTDLCCERISQLLKGSYWSADSPLCFNPFKFLPDRMIDKILPYVTQVKEDEMLERSHLQLLLTSGRITTFILCDLVENYTQPTKTKFCRREIVTPKNLYGILLDLMSNSLKLTVLKINLTKSYEYNSELRDALNILLSEAPNLKQVESTIKFDIRVLSNAVHLEELIIRFDLDDHNRIQDLFVVNGQSKLHTSLKYLTIDDLNDADFVDTEKVLECCPELISFNCDISEQLHHFHVQALSGDSAHQYKLEDIVLGPLNELPVSEDIICTASRVFPNTTKLKIWTHENLISHLRNFQNLEDLKLTFDWEYAGGWREAIGFPLINPALNRLLGEPTFGYKLTCLELRDAIKVDFSLIGNSCPNLEKLTVFYFRDQNRRPFLPTYFQKLVYLDLKVDLLVAVSVETLIGILSNAVNLKSLQLDSAEMLTDEVLRDIINKNTLSKLETLHLECCMLSLRGLEHLAVSLIALRYFSLFEYSPPIDGDVVAMFNAMNPKVTVTVITDKGLFLRVFPGVSHRYR